MTLWSLLHWLCIYFQHGIHGVFSVDIYKRFGDIRGKGPVTISETILNYEYVAEFRLSQEYEENWTNKILKC